MKKMLSLLLVIPSVVYFASAQSTPSISFFPYHTGDIRQYHSEFTGDLIYTIYTDSVVVIPITKDIMIYNRYENGMTTYGIDRIDSFGNVYNMSYQEQYIRYKLYADSGNSWQAGIIADTVPVIVAVVDVYKTNLFGKNVTVKAMRFQYQGVSQLSPFTIGTDYLAEGFGLIESQVEPSDQYVLTGAIINGVQYGTITSVNQELATIPYQAELFQNYPNPFNPTTTIKYQLPITSRVSLKIYDVLGREVVALVNGMKDAGSYTATFDGSKLASGMYFARMIVSPSDGSKQIVQVKKMLMLK